MSVAEPSYAVQTQEWLTDRGTSACASRKSPPPVNTLVGLDWLGLDWIGLDWIGLDWIGLDWTESPGPGQAHPVVTPKAITTVETIVKENSRVKLNEIAAHLDKSHGSADYIEK